MHKIELIGPTLAGIMLLSACAPATPQATQTPTLQPTETVTPTATQPPTPTPTATVEVDPYVIDMDKFLNPAPSYEYMVAHPEEFQAAPDLLSDVEAFKDWYYNGYIPALLAEHEEKMTDMVGNKFSKRDVVNVYLQGNGNSFGFEDTKTSPLSGELPIAYFIHDGVMYPILAFTINNGVKGNDQNIGTFSVILHPSEQQVFDDGFDAIKHLYEGKPVKDISQQMTADDMGPSYSEIVQKFLNDGFNWQVDVSKVGPFFNIGMGKVVARIPRK